MESTRFGLRAQVGMTGDALDVSAGEGKDPGMERSLHLAVALDGAGWHPAAWREDDARPGDLFTAGYWVDLAKEAERGLLDFVTIEDSLGPQSIRDGGPVERTDRVTGRLDAALVAARVAPRTEHVGLVPTVIVTHTEPFHISKSIATLDYVSTGRAGVRVQVSRRKNEADHFGRRDIPEFHRAEMRQPRFADVVADLMDEAADYVDVVRRLWDSWEDDAEIRDVATGRFVDIDKLHYIDFHGKWFNVKGPSITPRPPQGQPPVAALAHNPTAYRLAARAADIVFTTPRDGGQVDSIRQEIAAQQAESARGAEPLRVFADLVVFLDDDATSAHARLARLNETAGEQYTSDALIFTGTATQLADLLQAWAEAGLYGFRLRPGAIPHDLTAITRGLVPELQRRGAFRREYEATTLRGLLELERPANRYTSRRTA